MWNVAFGFVRTGARCRFELRPARLEGLMRFLPGMKFFRILKDGKSKLECGSFPGFALQRNLASMLFHDRFYNDQSEAGPRDFRRQRGIDPIEGLKDFLEVLFGNAHSWV